MADSVDDRIVSMKFDNATFEAKIGDTLKSLDRLQKSLDLSNSVKGLQNLDVGNANVNLEKMASTVEGIGSKFSAMGIAGITAIANISNRILDAGINFGKSFAFGPIQAGFGEMETKVGSIQTILANTARFGTTLDEVTKSLDQLNTYSDRTIYDFGAMTKNIGLFTNAGIRIEDATSMIQGFSNAAAASGTTAEGAAGAAYQLSQALSNGSVKLMDWRSLTNVGLGNKNMQQGIIDIAKAMGTLDDAGLEASEVQEHFNETLEKGWLTTGVMSTYLKTMAGDMDATKLKALGLSDTVIATLLEQQKTAFEAATKIRTFTQLIGTIKESIGSGWAETFEIILGNFNEATDLFTSINNAVGNFVQTMSNARNTLLEGWASFGGRTTVIESLKNILEALGMVLNGVKMAFRSMFPPATSANLLHATASFSDFTIALKELVDRILPHLTYMFGVVFSTIRIGYEIVKGITTLFINLFRAIIPDRSGTHVVGFFGQLAKALYTLNTQVLLGGIDKFFEVLNKLLVPAAKYIGDFTGKIIDFFFAFKYSDLASNAVRPLGKLSSVLVKMGAAFAVVGKVAGQFFDVLFKRDFVGGPLQEDSTVISVLFRIRDALTDVGSIAEQFFNIMFRRDFVGGFFQEDSKIVDILFRIRDAFVAAGQAVLSLDLVGILKSLGGLFKDLGEKVTDFFSSFNKTNNLDKATGQLKDLNDKATLFYHTISAQDLGGDGPFYKTTEDIERGSGRFSGFLQVMQDHVGAFFDTLKSMGDKLKSIGSQIKDAFANLFAGASLENIDVNDFVDLLNQVLFASFILTLRKMVSNIADLVKSVDGVFSQLGKTLKAFQRQANAGALIKIATALVLITGAVVVLSTIDVESLGAALGAMTAGFVELVAVMKLLDKVSSGGLKMVLLATAVETLAASLILLSVAVKIFASMDPAELAKGIGAAGIALAALAASTKLLQADSKGMIQAGIATGLIAAALIVLAGAVKIFSDFDPVRLAQGLAAMALSLAAIALTVGKMGPATILAAPGILILAYALIKIVDAINLFAAIPMGSMIKGLAGIAAALEIIVLTVGTLPPAFFLVAAGFPKFAKGLKVIAEAVEKMGSIDGKTLIKGVLAIGTMLGIIVVAINAMTGALAGAAALVVVTGALYVLTTVLEKLGNMSITEIAKGLGTLAAVFVVLGGAALVMTAILPQLLAFAIAMNLIGKAFLLFGAGAALIVGTFILLGQVGGENLENILKMAEKVAAELPKLLDIFVENLAKSAKSMVANGKIIANAFADMIINALDAVIRVIPKAAEVANKIADALIAFVANRLVDFVEMGFAILLALGRGLITNIEEMTRTAVIIMTKFMDTLADQAPSLVDSGVRLLVAFIDGISKNIHKIVDAAKNLIANFIWSLAVAAVELSNTAADALVVFLEGFATAITTHSKEIRQAGIDVAFAIIDGLTFGLVDPDKMKGLVKAGENLAGKVLGALTGFHGFDSHSPSRKTMMIAGHVAEGLALGFDKDTVAQNAAVRHAESIVKAFAETLSKMPEGLPGVEVNPVITPVLDLTKVQAASKNLDALMSVSTITPSVSLDQARLISTTAASVRTPDETSQNGSNPTQVTFEQNIYSPTPLSTNDIYRNTKSSFALAKEELGIS